MMLSCGLSDHMEDQHCIDDGTVDEDGHCTECDVSALPGACCAGVRYHADGCPKIALPMFTDAAVSRG